MAEKEGQEPEVVTEGNAQFDDMDTPGYKAPAKATLDEITSKDQEDESLQRYKQQLLGNIDNLKGDDEGNNVVVKKMALVIKGRPDVEVDLTGDLSKIKSNPFILKEGCEYRIRVEFRVKREIVSGLRYIQHTYRKGIAVDKSNFMVGSYGPKAEVHRFETTEDEAPKGMISRGHYSVKSKFTDDDKNIHLAWEWSFDIKKDWE